MMIKTKYQLKNAYELLLFLQKEEKKSIIEICPIRNVIARFGNKWALLVIYILNENGSIRFNQLARQIPDISTKVLSNTLHILEADGLVKRTVFPEVPIRVEYELTETVHLTNSSLTLSKLEKVVEIYFLSIFELSPP